MDNIPIEGDVSGKCFVLFYYPRRIANLASSSKTGTMEEESPKTLISCLSSSEAKRVKAKSLPTGGRPGAVDHKALFSTFEKEERKQTKVKRSSETNGNRYSCFSFQSSDPKRSSDDDSSLNSDTSCSSVEFHRPSDLNRDSNLDKNTQVLPKNEESQYTTNSYNSLRQLNSNSDQFFKTSNVFLDISYRCGKKDSTISSRSSKSSTDSWSRKERREALKARVEAKREQLCGSSSSDDESNETIDRYYSDEALHRSFRENRGRFIRTDRHFKRRSQEESSFNKLAKNGTSEAFLLDKKPEECQKKPPPAPQGNSGVVWQESILYRDPVFDPYNKSPNLDSSQSSYHSALESTKENYYFYHHPHCITRRTVSENIQPNDRIIKDKKPSPVKELTVCVVGGKQNYGQVSHPSPQDSGVSSQSVASSPSLGRAPTPPPRSPQSKVVINETAQQLKISHPTSTTTATTTTNQALSKRPHVSTIEAISQSNCNKSLQNETYTEKPFCITGSDMNTRPREVNQNVIRVSEPLIPTQAYNNKHQKDNFRSTKCYFKNNGPIKTLKGMPAYTDVPPYRILASISQSKVPVYSYTDQAPFSTQPDQTSRGPYEQGTQAYMSDSQVVARKKYEVLGRSLSDGKKGLGSHLSIYNKEGSSQITDKSDAYKTKESNMHNGISSSGVSSAMKAPLSPTLINDQTFLDLSKQNTYSRSSTTRDNSDAIESPNNQLERSSLSMSYGAPIPPTRRHSSATLCLDAKKKRMDQFMQREMEKRCSKNFEDALKELEEMYRSLKLNDENLLDRAERRDLPIKFQLSRPARLDVLQNSLNSDKESNPRSDVINYLMIQKDNNSIQSSADITEKESFDYGLNLNHMRRTRTPPARRSAVPDKITDDAAYRRIQNNVKKSPTSPDNNGNISYLLCSPAFTPTIEVEEFFKGFPLTKQPDIEHDDMSYRFFKMADAAKVLDPPPPFGIPKDPVTQASASNYLQATPVDVQRTHCRTKRIPDVVRDDVAFRNLRRDNQLRNKENIPNMVFQEVDGTFKGLKSTTECFGKKKHRAVRSLSANIAHVVEEEVMLPFERAQSMTDIIAALEKQASEWEKFGSSGKPEESSSTITETPHTTMKGRLYQGNSSSIQRERTTDHLTSTETLTESRAEIENRVKMWNYPKKSSQNDQVAILKDNPKDQQSEKWHIRVTTPSSKAARQGKRPLSLKVWTCDKQSEVPYANLSSTSGIKSSLVTPPRKTLVPPKRIPQGFWSDTEGRPKSKVTPFDERHLDELLTSLLTNTSPSQSPTWPSLNHQRYSTGYETKKVTDIPEGDELLKILDYGDFEDMSGATKTEAFPFTLIPSSSTERAMTETARRPLRSQPVGRDYVGAGISSLRDSDGFLRPVGFSSVIGMTGAKRSDESVSDNVQKERMLMYKEERRRQIAKRYSEKSSEDELVKIGEEPSYMRYSQRRSKKKSDNSQNKEDKKSSKNAEEVSPSVSKIAESHPNSCAQNIIVPNSQSSTRRRFITRDSSGSENVTANSQPLSLKRESGNVHGGDRIRSTRASRLRAEANSSLFENSGVKIDGLQKKESFRNKAPAAPLSSSEFETCASPSNFRSDTSPVAKDYTENVREEDHEQVTTEESHTKNTESEESSEAGVAKEKVKDKSYKRKSNLNRASLIEEHPHVVSDTCEESPRRSQRWRKNSDSTSLNSGSEKKGLGSALFNRCSGVSVKDHQFQSKEESCDSQSDIKSDKSKISQLVQKQQEAPTRKQSFDQTPESSPRKTSSALKRPEIPKVFRHNSSTDPEKKSSLRSRSERLLRRAEHGVSSGTDKGDKSQSENDERRPKSTSVITRASNGLQTESLKKRSRSSPNTHSVHKDNSLSQTPPSKKLHSDQNIIDFDTKDKETSVGSIDRSLNIETKNVLALETPHLISEFETVCKKQSRSGESKKTNSSSYSTVSASTQGSGSSRYISCDNTFPQELDTEVDEVFSTPPDTLERDLNSSVIYTLSISTKSKTFGDCLETTNPSLNLGESSYSPAYSTTFNTLQDEESSNKVTIKTASCSRYSPVLQPEDLKEELVKEMSSGENKRRYTRKRDISVNKSTISSHSLTEAKNSSESESVSIKKTSQTDNQGAPSLKSLVTETKIRDSTKLSSEEPRKESKESKSHSVLKSRLSSEERETRSQSPEVHSILKNKTDKIESSSNNLQVHPILKHRTPEETAKTQSEPKPILKQRNSFEELSLDHKKSEPKPILKKKYSTEDECEDKPKSILKTKSTHDSGSEGSNSQESKIESDSGVKPILKKAYMEGEYSKPVSILRTSSPERSNKSDSSECGVHAKNISQTVAHHSFQAGNQTIEKDNNEGASIKTDQPLSILKVKDSSSSLLTRELTPPSILKKPKEADSFTNELSSVLKIRKGKSSQEEETTVQKPKSATSHNELESLNSERIQLIEGSAFQKKICKGKSVKRFDHRNAPRYRTQPVTVDELNETDGLESVQAFRALVMKKASFDIFSQREKELAPEKLALSDKRKEYPQPYRPDKKKDRRQGVRYRTLPVTLEEISHASDRNSSVSSPLNSPVSMPKPIHPKSESSEELQLKTSGSEDELSKMSVAAKATLFKQLEAQHKQPVQAIGAKRKIANRRFLPRSQTQPITEEEVHEAAKLVKEDDKSSESNHEEADKNNSVNTDENKTASDSEDDPVNLSLADKMKLFNQKIGDEKNKPPTVASDPNSRRRCSRFKTQPVTSDEIEIVNKVSLLAASISRFHELKEDTGQISHSKTFTPPAGGKLVLPLLPGMKKTVASDKGMTSSEDTDSTNVNKGILKKETSHPTDASSRGIVVSNISSNSAIKNEPFVESSEIKGILKTQNPDQEHPVLKPILKPEGSFESKEESSESSSTSSSEDDSDEEESGGGYTGSKTVLTGGQSHIIFGTHTSRTEEASLSASSSIRETKKITNPAVQRRLNASIRKKEERRSMHEVRSHEVLSSASSSSMYAMEAQKSLAAELQRTFAMHSQHLITSECSDGSGTDQEQHKLFLPTRSRTQPLTQDEKDGVEELGGGSIAERLAALKRNGEENWKKRLEKNKTDKPEEEIQVLASTIVKKREEKSLEPRPRSLVENRKLLLEESGTEWRQRVEEKDASKFTVAGKMGKQSLQPEKSPLADRKKRTPKPVKFRSKTTNIGEVRENSTQFLSVSPVPITKSKSMPDAIGKDESSSRSSEDEEEVPVRVLVPKADNETFSSFFESLSAQKAVEEKIEIKDEDFKCVISQSESHHLLAQRKSVKLHHRRVASRNPIKALASRTDLQHEYTEVKSGYAEQEMKRIKLEQMAKTSNKALSALAGLASTEDFKAIALKKGVVGEASPIVSQKDAMLVQIKGRRHVQTRLVEPNVRSLNHGDSFVLITPSKVFLWIGEYSNVIEKAKGAEVAAVIQAKKDLCFKGTDDVITLDEEKKPSRNHLDVFFRHLGTSDKNCRPPGKPEEDEIYEAAIIDTNMIYKVEGDELVPYEEYWGNLPRIEMLKPDEILVFDFGSEMYVWQGKKAPFEQRSVSVRLAKELWDQGFNYSECDINPLYPEPDVKVLMKGNQRPSWALFTKVSQHMEPVLFREKFFDWPDTSRLIKVKGQESDETKQTEGMPELKPCDVKNMLEQERMEPDLILEGSHLGRGLEYHDEKERRHFEITTNCAKVWHILEYKHSQMPLESYGQFHSGDTYVVRWQYTVKNTGRDLSGQASKHSSVGRKRCAYFFWQGRSSTVTEKGACALMTVELDEERGPHVRVVEGQEPPCFLNIFNGEMVVYKGKRDEDDTNTKSLWRMFMTRGSFPSEAILMEISRGVQSLRSRSSFVLINTSKGFIFVWHGAKSPRDVQKTVMSAANKLKDRQPKEMMFDSGINIEIKEIHEGSESRDFWEGLGGKNRHMYMSLLKSRLTYNYTPRLFHLTSVSGTFSSTEVQCTYYSTKHVCPYPFLQSELYNATQPALFLFDNEREIFLWQGWWPEGDEESENVVTGSAGLRWNTERRCAMETALHYCLEKNPENPPKAFIVSAGLEPTLFTNLFLTWEQHDDVALINIKDGKKPGEMLLVQEVLAKLTRTRYTLSELQKRPLPEGVDPSRIESYLTDEDFEDILGMSKEEFYTLPPWRHSELKKAAGLF